MEITQKILDEYLLIAKELFRYKFLSIGIGSISLKIDKEKILINKKNKHIDEEDFLLKINISNYSIQWEEATSDIKIHAKIYNTFSSTKAIGILFLKDTLKVAKLPKFEIYNQTIPVIEINNIEKFNEMNTIIAKLKDSDILIIKNYGVIIKSRDVREIIKKAILLENISYII